MSDRLLEANGIGVDFAGRSIINDVDLTLSRGEILTLIGPNGAGKSTLVRALLGLLKPSRGTVKRDPKARLGYMPQRLNLSDNLPLTAERFLSLGLKGSGKANQQGLENAIRETGVQALLASPMQQLSGGETQRVLLARALARDPDLLVLDEPVQGVDVTGQAELYGLIARIRDRHHCGVLMVSHDLHLVMTATDQVLCLNGHVCCSGHPSSVSQDPAYLELFGVQADPRLSIYTHHHDHAHDIHGDVVAVEDAGEGGKSCGHRHD
ncbi:MAG: zinc ABC transporter ATP-binding protein ZnuC [Gammaproteobacteria bacterium]